MSAATARHWQIAEPDETSGHDQYLSKLGSATVTIHLVFGVESKPSWYIVATKDQTIQPELERFVAKRMGATIFETDSSHVPCCLNPSLCWTLFEKLQELSWRRHRRLLVATLLWIS